jgi:hypothetical protein
MELSLPQLRDLVRQRAVALAGLPRDTLSRLPDADFADCLADMRAWNGGSAAWAEAQALACASLQRKLALLNLVLDHVTAEDHAYASGASSGGEGRARSEEIREVGFNPEADRVRGLIRKAIMG